MVFWSIVVRVGMRKNRIRLISTQSSLSHSIEVVWARNRGVVVPSEKCDSSKGFDLCRSLSLVLA